MEDKFLQRLQMLDTLQGSELETYKVQFCNQNSLECLLSLKQGLENTLLEFNHLYFRPLGITHYVVQEKANLIKDLILDITNLITEITKLDKGVK